VFLCGRLKQTLDGAIAIESGRPCWTRTSDQRIMSVDTQTKPSIYAVYSVIIFGV